MKLFHRRRVRSWADNVYLTDDDGNVLLAQHLAVAANSVSKLLRKQDFASISFVVAKHIDATYDVFHGTKVTVIKDVKLRT